MIDDDQLGILLARSNPVRIVPIIAERDKASFLESIYRQKPDGVDIYLDTVRLHDAVKLEFRGQVAVMTFDDGKANILTVPILHAFIKAIDLCESDGETTSLAIVGRPGFLSAGLDRNKLSESVNATNESVDLLALLLVRLYSSSVRITVACTGHAIAAGALLLLAADRRIGEIGSFKIGMNEVSVGITLPDWAIEFANQRLSKSAYQRTVSTGHLYSPVDVVGTGFLDVIVEDNLITAVIEEAEELAALDPVFYNEITLPSRDEHLNTMRDLMKKSETRDLRTF